MSETLTEAQKRQFQATFEEAGRQEIQRRRTYQLGEAVERLTKAGFRFSAIPVLKEEPFPEVKPGTVAVFTWKPEGPKILCDEFYNDFVEAAAAELAPEGDDGKPSA